MENKKKKIYFIVGPTASGKTALSIELAKKLKIDNTSAEIISADSRQIYRDLNLSTGKVTKEEMENIPHHMLDIVDPGEYFSVMDYVEMTLIKIEEIYDRGHIPIVVGGTGFYIDSLLYNYNLPEVKKDDALRAELETKTQEELFAILEKLNLEYADKIRDNFEYRNNNHRMMRTIEVIKSLGYFPELKKEERFNEDEYYVEIIKTEFNLEKLRPKIYTRLIERIDAGMIEEIKNVAMKYDLSFEYLEGLGLEFKWVGRFIRDEITKEEMIEKLNIEIGQYAKRQIAWFKRY